MNKKIVIISIVIILVAIVIGAVVLYNNSINGENVQQDTEITIDIGTGSSKIASILKENNAIKSETMFKIYVRLNKINNFQAGNYKLEEGMNVPQIVELLQTGKMYNDSIKITFVEGKNMRWIASKIDECTNNTQQDVFNLLEDEEYIDSLIEKYWFLTDEIKDEDIYYPLEGYLWPDTYEFESEEVTLQEIFETLLNQTDKVLSKYKEKIENTNITVHQYLTIASIIENEAIMEEDRKDVSSVIYNRIKNDMAIGSDVTTYYAIKVDIGERDLKKSELNTYNPYNTRGPKMNGKIPIGPISSVSESSLEAAIQPNNTSYLYFVADKNGKVYFTRTNAEHEEKINKLKNDGLWYEF